MARRALFPERSERPPLNKPIRLEYRSVPGALAFMARAIIVPARFRRTGRLSSLAASWRGHRVAGRSLDDYLALTGLAEDTHWPLLYPLVLGFRLQMTLLTHPAFPFPIWNALQIRNHVTLHRPFARNDVLDLHASVEAQRGLEKGTEVDLRNTAHVASELAWECVNTIYYRGVRSSRAEASAVAAAPTVDAPIAAQWIAPVGGRWRFGRLTGDYNGIHLTPWYARLFGFRGAFQHPQRALGECLARLPRPAVAAPLRLDAWLKGPVYYGAELALRVAETGNAMAFALHVDGDERPAIVGRRSMPAVSGSPRA